MRTVEGSAKRCNLAVGQYSRSCCFSSLFQLKFTLDWTNFSTNLYIKVEIVLGAGKIERIGKKTSY